MLTDSLTPSRLEPGTGAPWALSPTPLHFSPGPGASVSLQSLPRGLCSQTSNSFLSYGPGFKSGVQIPTPLLASCVTSESLLKLSDFSFLVLEVELSTPPSESWPEAYGGRTGEGPGPGGHLWGFTFPLVPWSWLVL